MEEWCKKHSVDVNGADNLTKVEDVNDLFKREIDKLNQGFGHVEQIKKFELLTDEWAIDTGELTPTMKIKRKVIKQMYLPLIEKIYRG